MTFSIVARDETTGALGVAVAAGQPAIGALVPHGFSQVGVLASQGIPNPLYGPQGLAQLGSGVNAACTLERLLSADKGRAGRQLIVLDRFGHTAAWTGAECEGYAGHVQADQVAIAGSFLSGRGVLQRMMNSWLKSGGKPLATRLLLALLAGEQAGGDVRGIKSAALRVYGERRYPDLDLRVDWCDTALVALKAALKQVQSAAHTAFLRRLPVR
jgi:uncharacterized Ntn-hydrolase superfamily protein